MKTDNILRLSFHRDPSTLDPQKSADTLSSALIFLLFKGLMRFEPNHQLRCDLADSFYMLNDYRKYVFRLGKHFWSNGIPITAHDFVYSWKRAISPQFPLVDTHFFFHIKNASKAKKGEVCIDSVGIYARDDYTLEVELEHPTPHFLELVSFCTLFPVCSKTIKKESSFPLCSGPFQIEKWIPGQEILLKKNPFCKNLLPVYLDGIHIQIISDTKEAFNLFENGQLDWVGNPLSPLPANYLPALIAKKQIKPVTGITFCWFNTLSSPFSSASLRKAFSLAIPRKKLLEKLILPNALSASRFFPSIPACSDVPSIIQEDASEARDLFQIALRELKIKQPRIMLNHEDTYESTRLAIQLKAFWQEAFEISIQLRPLSFKEFWYVHSQRDFQLSLVRFLPQYTDPVNFLEKLEFKNTINNLSGWENVKYQLLLKQYRKIADHKKRMMLIEKMESILLNEMPIMPICHYHYVYSQKPYIKNLSVSPIGVMQFDRVFFEKQCETLRTENYSFC